MDVYKIVNQLKQNSEDYFFIHDMKLPISADVMYNIMRIPENWQIVNFPIINKAEVIERKNNSIIFIINEKLLGRYYRSKIHLTFDNDNKCIEYYHSNLTFPFVSKMASIWYFVDDGAYSSRFYIIRQFNVKNVFIKYVLFGIVKNIINKHVHDYYKQLIALTKTISLFLIISHKEKSDYE